MNLGLRRVSEVAVAEVTNFLSGEPLGKKVLVVGDIGLDEYVFGSVRRISPEAPVPVVEVTAEEQRLGMAANVAQNVASLGGEPVLVGVVGCDRCADQIRELLRENRVSPEFLVEDEGRPTTRKSRVLAGHHHVVRVDHERCSYLNDKVAERMLDAVARLMPEVSGVVIEDYGKGVVNRRVVGEIVRLAKQQNKKVIVDPHRTTSLGVYEGVNIIKPNFEESIVLSAVIWVVGFV